MRSALDGRGILVLEDEPLIALDVGAMLADAGARVIGPAHSEAEAMVLIDAAVEDADGASRMDGAVLDVHLGDLTSEAVAARLSSLAVPFVFHSGVARGTGTFAARSVATYLRKLASAEDLIAALGGARDRPDA